MTTKERLHKLVDELSEDEAIETLRYAAARYERPRLDEWGDLDVQTTSAEKRATRDLNAEELAERGQTIATAWGYQRST